MVVRPMACCGAVDSVGYVYRVTKVLRMHVLCSNCGHRYGVDSLAVEWEDEFASRGHVTSRLIRIDPLTEPECVETEREVTA